MLALRELSTFSTGRSATWLSGVWAWPVATPGFPAQVRPWHFVVVITALLVAAPVVVIEQPPSLAAALDATALLTSSSPLYDAALRLALDYDRRRVCREARAANGRRCRACGLFRVARADVTSCARATVSDAETRATCASVWMEQARSSLRSGRPHHAVAHAERAVGRVQAIADGAGAFSTRRGTEHDAEPAAAAPSEGLLLLSRALEAAHGGPSASSASALLQRRVSAFRQRRSSWRLGSRPAAAPSPPTPSRREVRTGLGRGRRRRRQPPPAGRAPRHWRRRPARRAAPERAPRLPRLGGRGDADGTQPGEA